MANTVAAWSFIAGHDEWDGPRILREALEAGAQLIRVERNGKRLLFCTPDYAKRLSRAEKLLGPIAIFNYQHRRAPVLSRETGEISLGHNCESVPDLVLIRFHRAVDRPEISAAELHERVLEAERIDAQRRTHVECYA